MFYWGNEQTFIDPGAPALIARGGGIYENVTKLIRKQLKAMPTVGEVVTYRLERSIIWPYWDQLG